MSRTVLITGCSSGFGEATARLFAARGWNVVATMRRPETGAALAALDNVLVTRLDVQDRASIEAAMAEAIARFGRIDVLDPLQDGDYALTLVVEKATSGRVKLTMLPKHPSAAPGTWRCAATATSTWPTATTTCAAASFSTPKISRK